MTNRTLVINQLIRVTLSVLLLGVSVLAVSPLAVEQQPLVEQRDTLRGLSQMGVAVGTLKADAEADGLRATEMRTDVELKLRLGGIDVRSDEEVQSKRIPYLLVGIQTLKHIDDSYTYSIELELHQVVTLASGAKANAVTWSVGYFGRVGSKNLQNLRDRVKDRADEFVNDWLAVNPKRP